MRRLLLTLCLAGAPAAALAIPPLPPPEPPQPSTPPPYQFVPPRTPPADLLGQAWEQEEVAGWRAVWIRRGNSRIFDAYWSHPNGERVLVPLEIFLQGRRVIVIRRHAGGQYVLPLRRRLRARLARGDGALHLHLGTHADAVERARDPRRRSHPGNLKTALSPPSGERPSRTSPPWPRATSRAMASPRPTPLLFWLRDSSRRLKGLNASS